MMGMGRRGFDFSDNSFGGMNFDVINALRQQSRGGQSGGFEDRRRNLGGLSNTSKNVAGQSSDSSGEVAMKSVVMNADNVVSFIGRRHYLSTFHNAPMIIAGHHYPTVEHYYEACKMFAIAGPESAMYLKDVQDPAQVKATVKRIVASQNIPRRTIEQWKSQDGLLVARVALMEKFRQNPKLREQLFQTGDALLVQCNKGDILWSTNTSIDDFNNWLKEHNGQRIDFPVMVDQNSLHKVPEICKGKNVLGFILMYVRDCLRSEYGVVSR